jgi:hypothetical protein
VLLQVEIVWIAGYIFFMDENGIRCKWQNIQKLKKLGQWMEMEWVGKDKFKKIGQWTRIELVGKRWNTKYIYHFLKKEGRIINKW